MSNDFEAFMKKFLEAIKKRDTTVMKNVYSEWAESSGIFKNIRREDFFTNIFKDLKDFQDLPIKKCEPCGEFMIARLGSNDDLVSLVFMKKGGNWVFFNEMSNFALFSKAYTLDYKVKGDGIVRFLFNGKQSPVIDDIEGGSSGFMSPINSALVVGRNELTIQLLKGKGAKASIKINGTDKGGVADSSEGNVLSWEGDLSKPVVLKFDTR